MNYDNYDVVTVGSSSVHSDVGGYLDSGGGCHMLGAKGSWEIMYFPLSFAMNLKLL